MNELRAGFIKIRNELIMSEPAVIALIQAMYLRYSLKVPVVNTAAMPVRPVKTIRGSVMKSQ